MAMSGALIETSLKQALPHLGALVLFALAVCGFYAKSFDGYEDIISKKENFEKIVEYEKKVEYKKKEIEDYMNSIDNKSNVIMGFSQPQ